MDVPVPQFQKKTVEVSMVIPQERTLERIYERIDVDLALQIQEQIVKTVKTIPRARSWT